jgi:MoaA/NifB/PqqE/SkfB family radical SAM enzyme
MLAQTGVRQVTLTGTNTDPQLYRHEEALIDYLRKHVLGAQLNLHTNGTLALRRMATFNRYDRATVSLASFDVETCRRMTGRAKVLDLAAIVSAAQIPIKISTLVTEHNIAEIPVIIARCRSLGIRRMVLRHRHPDPVGTPLFPRLGRGRLVRFYGGNPVFDVDGLEVTIWDFGGSSLSCLNLFSDGTIDGDYMLDHPRSDSKAA